MTAVRSRQAGALPAEFAELAPDSWTEPYWLACREHRLVIPQCTQCGTFRFPPSPFCFTCRSQAVEHVEVAGTGAVYTFTIARHPVVPSLAESVPYIVAVVEIDGAPDVRMITEIVGCAPEEIEIGSSVRVSWDDVDEFVTIPRFVLESDPQPDR
jgi:uncharacterized OB-fold protein